MVNCQFLKLNRRTMALSRLLSPAPFYVLHCTYCRDSQTAILPSLGSFVSSHRTCSCWPNSSCEPPLRVPTTWPRHCRRPINRRSRRHIRGTGSRALCRCQPLHPRCVQHWPAHATLRWCRLASGAEDGCAGAIRLQGPEVAELGPRVHHLLHRPVINLPSPQMVRQPQACTMHPANCSASQHSWHIKITFSSRHGATPRW